MTRRTIATYTAVAAFALASGPGLWAQARPNPSGQSSGSSAGARPNSGGGSSGSAVSRPSGGGSSGGSTSSSSGGSSSGGSSAGGFSSGGDSGGYRPARPERRPESRAVPRSGASANSGEQRRVSPGGAAASAGDTADPRRRAVPTYARPRDGRNVTGSAVDRRLAGPTRPGGDIFINPFNRYSYYYNRYPYGYYWPGYGFGMGYFYDPYLWGYGPGNYYDPYYYGGYGGGGGYVQYREGQYRPVGSLRLKVEPRNAQVYVDGYYVGEVDSFDGVFQKLTIEEGAHRVEIRAQGYETAQFEVMVIPGQTVTYKGDMKRVQ